MYNDFHRIEGSEDARFKLWEERLSEAFFLYTISEFSQRAGIKTEFKFKEEGGDQMKWIDRALESYHSKLRDFFFVYIGLANTNATKRDACGHLCLTGE